jgi:hypothetical protein
MHRIVLTAQVDDPVEWEKKFRTHGDLFRRMGTNVTHFGVGEDNHVAIYVEVDDVQKYYDVFRSEDAAKAMADDNVRRETVKVFELDREFRY